MKTQARMVLGRRLMVRNLIEHLKRGAWAVVAGGPKMGKTTLLQQVAGNRFNEIQPLGIDLQKTPKPELKRLLIPDHKPTLLLIDSCEALLPGPTAFVNQVMELLKERNPAVQGLVWAGNVAWGEWAMAHRRDFGHPLRYYPLVVLPPKEARPLLAQGRPHGTPIEEIERLLDLSGGHPYLLKVLLKTQEIYLDDFFADVWAQAGSASEQAVLRQLVSAGSWVLLSELQDERGRKPPKPILDRLTTLGLIIRTLVDGAAAVRIVSPLFSDWVRVHGIGVNN